jgi:hypothetical protein
MSRRNKRNKPHNTPPSQRKGDGPERTYQFTEPPPRPPVIDTTRMSVASFLGAESQVEPPRDSDSEGAQQAGFGSRGNRLESGLRSRLLFPDRVQQLIDERTQGYGAQLVARTLLEWWCISQIAMGTVQSDLANDQLRINASLAVQRVDTPRWAEDRRENAEKLGQRISTAPSRIAAQLGRCKYGALYLLERLNSLAESIASNGCLDDEQRACLFDYIGVDHVFRNGSRKVPPGDNGPALAEAVQKEICRLTTKVECELNARDLQEQAAARLGIVRFYDQETRNLRGALTRADRRVKWGYKVLAEIRAGVDPATILDNETGKPIKPDANFSPPGQAAPPPPPPPPPAPPAEPPAEAAPAGSDSTFQMPAFLEGCSEDQREMYILWAESAHRDVASAGKPSPAEPGPVPSA